MRKTTSKARLFSWFPRRKLGFSCCFPMLQDSSKLDAGVTRRQSFIAGYINNLFFQQSRRIMGKYTIQVVLIVALLSLAQLSEGKRTYSGSRRAGSSSSSSSSRRQSHTSSSGHVTKPTFQQSNSHADQAKLSYAGYNQQPNRPAQAASAPAASAPVQNTNSQPIGWNVPKHDTPAVAVNKAPVQSAGPPPPYSPHNVQGARTNVNEAPPPYSAVGGYPASQQHAGIPAGAVYYPAGHHQPGYQPMNYPQQSHGMYPQQPGYHPASGGGYPGAPASYPGGAGYPQQGGGFPAASPPVYQGAAIQPGYYPAGSMPIGAQQSSGPGFGTGLLAGAVGGAVLGHVLTPSGGSGSSSDQEKVIIINNTGAPAAVAPAPGTPAVAPGTPAVAPAAVGPAAIAPAVAPVPGAPAVSSVPDASGMTPAPGVPIPAIPTNTNETSTPTPLAPMPGETNPAPQSYGLMCVPVMVNVTDPANPANVTVVEQIACYNVTQPPPPPPAQPEMIAPQPVQQQPQFAAVNPPPTQKTSTATLAESANIKSGSPATTAFGMLSTITAIIISYCLH